MLRSTLALVLAAVGVSPALSQASAEKLPLHATAAAVVIPPELQALEQKTLQLQLTSIRFSLSESVAGQGAPAGPFAGLLASVPASLALLTVTGEESFVPQAATFQVNVLGFKVNGRLLGTTLYVDEPFIAREDHGRPWVVEQHQDLQQAVGVQLAALGGNAGSGATQAFGKLLETINNASSIQGLGPTTVDGQLTSGFAGSVDLSKVGNVTATARKALLKLVEPVAHVEVFFAEDGLPVRTLIAIVFRPHAGKPRGELIVQSDIPAINVPVVVAAPPAGKTITMAALKKLLKRKRHYHSVVRSQGSGKSK
jgi:hypothetical protein